MRYVKPVKSFFHGDRSYSADDAPFPVHDSHAGILIQQGLAVAHVPVEHEEGLPLPADGEPEIAVNPAPRRARKATAKA